jgi:hypothetical protein
MERVATLRTDPALKDAVNPPAASLAVLPDYLMNDGTPASRSARRLTGWRPDLVGTTLLDSPRERARHVGERDALGRDLRRPDHPRLQDRGREQRRDE